MKADILSASDETDAPKRAITYYVSEKHGDDRNDGLSPETAVKTLDGLRAVGGKRENKRLLFERGGIYRGAAPHFAPNGLTTYPCWELFPHTTIGAYGEGPKPVWVQSQRNYTDPSQYVDGKDPFVRLTEDVRIRYNVVRDTGYGWGSVCKERMRSSQCYCGTTLSPNRDELTEYNIFDRSAGFLLHLAENSEEIDSKNVYIQIESSTLGNLRGTGRTVCDEHFADNVRDVWGDKEAVVVLIPKD